MQDRASKSRFYIDNFPRRSGRSKYFAYLGTYMLFVEQPVVSLSLYNGANEWLLGPGRDESTKFNRSHSKMNIRNRWSPIHISHGFAFELHILHKSDNLLHYMIAHRRCDKPNSVQSMKSWDNYATSFDAGLITDHMKLGLWLLFCHDVDDTCCS